MRLEGAGRTVEGSMTFSGYKSLFAD